MSVERVGGHARYGMLETIRQFAEGHLAASGTIDQVRDRHADYFAEQAVARWELCDGPRQRVALDWVDVEFANLRAAFRWAADHADVAAAAIAAHTAMLAFSLQQFEPVGWAEELLAAATIADVAQLPRLYTAAAMCSYTGRPDTAVKYAHTAVELEATHRYDSFETGWASIFEATAHAHAGRIERWLEICNGLTDGSGLARIIGLCGRLYAWPMIDRADEARAIADEAVTAARAHGNPFWIAFALWASGRAFAQTDPTRALTTLHQALDYTRDHRLPILEAIAARDAAALEALHGDAERALALFDTAIDSLHRAGNIVLLALTLASLAAFFARVDQPDVAAIVYGTSTYSTNLNLVTRLPSVLDHLRAVLSPTAFDDYVATGAAMDLADAVHYARHNIQLTRQQLEDG